MHEGSEATRGSPQELEVSATGGPAEGLRSLCSPRELLVTVPGLTRKQDSPHVRVHRFWAFFQPGQDSF